MPSILGDELQQIEDLYASVGRITVLTEHLNHAMVDACSLLLKGRDGNDEFVKTALAGQKLENARRTWEAMLKLAFRDDEATTKIIDHLSARVDNVNKRRNDTIHRVWYIGLRDPQTNSFKIAEGKKYEKVCCPASKSLMSCSSLSTYLKVFDSPHAHRNGNCQTGRGSAAIFSSGNMARWRHTGKARPSFTPSFVLVLLGLRLGRRWCRPARVMPMIQPHLKIG